MTRHNRSAWDVVVKKLSEVCEVRREACADFHLVVVIVHHVADPPAAGKEMAIFALSSRHFYA